ncbi:MULTISPECIES: Rz-like lysis system protein LysB [unclassified Caballeronia]|uniref:Rz-like lysis system protein LysB n=1 Tax=unclassified Caballeronia TaxID=2646786 RepID=UPI0020280DF2|nr:MULTISPECIES: Rz-like lysis system protein LysB [unclassified Caballeronia]MDR5797444.1 Rz-like lysis system protein LysB [Caballeronia sp. LZ008]
MNPIIAKLVAGAIVIAALVGGVLYVRELHAELDDANHQLETAKQGIVDRNKTIADLQRNASEKAKQQAQLDKSTTAVHAAVTSERQAIKKVINENPTVRTWADTPLPADVVRLSASPAYTGTADFGAAVSDDHSVHAAGDGSDN